MNSMHAPRWRKKNIYTGKTNVARVRKSVVRFAIHIQWSVLWYNFIEYIWCWCLKYESFHTYHSMWFWPCQICFIMLNRVDSHLPDRPMYIFEPWKSSHFWMWSMLYPIHAHMVQSMGVMWFKSGNVSHWMPNWIDLPSKYNYTEAEAWL